MSPGISNGPRTRDWSNPASAVASALLPGSAAPAAWPCWPVDSHTSDCRSYTEYSSLGVRLVECFSWQPGRTSYYDTIEGTVIHGWLPGQVKARQSGMRRHAALHVSSVEESIGSRSDPRMSLAGQCCQCSHGWSALEVSATP